MCLGFKIKTLCILLSMYSSRGRLRNINGQYLGSICDESLMWLGLNLNPGGFVTFTFIFVSCGESYLLVS
jgi:hypothetical protein